MVEAVVLHGYRYSVYNRIARMVLHEKGVEYTREEINPFEGEISAPYLKLHPFGRVPVLCHGTFAIYETTAITRYVDARFDGPQLTPVQPATAARMAQVISIIDGYGYWPMVRQVCSHRVFRPLEGEPWSEDEVMAGLAASLKVLAALEDIASGGHVLNGDHLTLADCHLAPMIDYFVRAPEGDDALGRFQALSHWWSRIRTRPSLIETDPGPFTKSQ